MRILHARPVCRECRKPIDGPKGDARTVCVACDRKARVAAQLALAKGRA